MDKQVEQIIKLVIVMGQSRYNLVIFRDTPELWYQYYLGLFLKKPTIIIIQKADIGFSERLKNPLVKKIIEIETFDKNVAEEAVKEIVKQIENEKEI